MVTAVLPPKEMVVDIASVKLDLGANFVVARRRVCACKKLLKRKTACLHHAVNANLDF